MTRSLRRSAPRTIGRRAACRRSGFTLIELVVVVTVFLLLTAMTYTVANQAVTRDRVRGAARQVQSALAGGRDRAIFSGSEGTNRGTGVAGVRFLPDAGLGNNMAGDPIGLSSAVFIELPQPLRTRLVVKKNSSSPSGWQATQVSAAAGTLGVDGRQVTKMGTLRDRNLLRQRSVGNYTLTVRFDDTPGDFHVLNFSDSDIDANGLLTDINLSKAFTPDSFNGRTVFCTFELRSAVLPADEPRLLPTGSVIDVASSRVGGQPLAGFLTGGNFDILFNARGTVEGPLAGLGSVHLVVAEARDLEAGFRIDLQQRTVAGQPAERQGEEFIITLRTQTGSIGIADINPSPTQPVSGTSMTTDPNYDPLLDPMVNPNGLERTDAFLYAETGAEGK